MVNKNIPKAFSELEIRDDFMFGKITENPEVALEMLEILLDRKIEAIEYLDNQKSICITSEGKKVRLDSYIEDDEGTVYNSEMQNFEYKAARELPKRSRYYQGMIDLNLIQAGAAYHELKRSYVIFICTYDPFGAGRIKYTFENRCIEDKEISLHDETVKTFFNTKGYVDEPDNPISDRLKNLLHYIETKEATDEFTHKVDAMVERIRNNEEWERDYMKTLVHDMDVFRDGKEKGLEEGIEKGIRVGEAKMIKQMLMNGMTKESVAFLTGKSVKEIEELMIPRDGV